jgi:hypothetical protein
MPAPAIRQVTDLHRLAPRARARIQAALEERLGPVSATFDFHREWNGGWRCRVEVTGRGTLEFVLFVTPADALLALPHPLPARWADGLGVAAEDGTRWSLDAAGQVVRLDGTGATAAPHGTPGETRQRART